MCRRFCACGRVRRCAFGRLSCGCIARCRGGRACCAGLTSCVRCALCAATGTCRASGCAGRTTRGSGRISSRACCAASGSSCARRVCRARRRSACRARCACSRRISACSSLHRAACLGLASRARRGARLRLACLVLRRLALALRRGRLLLGRRRGSARRRRRGGRLLLLTLRVARALFAPRAVLLAGRVDRLLRLIAARVRLLRGVSSLVDRVHRGVLHRLVIGDFACLFGRLLRAVRARLGGTRRADDAHDRRDGALDHVTGALLVRELCRKLLHALGLLLRHRQILLDLLGGLLGGRRQLDGLLVDRALVRLHRVLRLLVRGLALRDQRLEVLVGLLDVLRHFRHRLGESRGVLFVRLDFFPDHHSGVVGRLDQVDRAARLGHQNRRGLADRSVAERDDRADRPLHLGASVVELLIRAGKVAHERLALLLVLVGVRRMRIGGRLVLYSGSLVHPVRLLDRVVLHLVRGGLALVGHLARAVRAAHQLAEQIAARRLQLALEVLEELGHLFLAVRERLLHQLLELLGALGLGRRGGLVEIPRAHRGLEALLRRLFDRVEDVALDLRKQLLHSVFDLLLHVLRDLVDLALRGRPEGGEDLLDFTLVRLRVLQAAAVSLVGGLLDLRVERLGIGERLLRLFDERGAHFLRERRHGLRERGEVPVRSLVGSLALLDRVLGHRQRLLRVVRRATQRSLRGVLRVLHQLGEHVGRGLDLLLRVLDLGVDVGARGAALGVVVGLRFVEPGGRLGDGGVARLLQIHKPALIELARGLFGLREQLLRGVICGLRLLEDWGRGRLARSAKLVFEIGRRLDRLVVRALAVVEDDLRRLDCLGRVVLRPVERVVAGLRRLGLQIGGLLQRRLDVRLHRVDEPGHHALRLRRLGLERRGGGGHACAGRALRRRDRGAGLVKRARGDVGDRGLGLVGEILRGVVRRLSLRDHGLAVRLRRRGRCVDQIAVLGLQIIERLLDRREVRLHVGERILRVSRGPVARVIGDLLRARVERLHAREKSLHARLRRLDEAGDVAGRVLGRLVNVRGEIVDARGRRLARRGGRRLHVVKRAGVQLGDRGLRFFNQRLRGVADLLRLRDDRIAILLGKRRHVVGELLVLGVGLVERFVAIFKGVLRVRERALGGVLRPALRLLGRLLDLLLQRLRFLERSFDRLLHGSHRRLHTGLSFVRRAFDVGLDLRDLVRDLLDEGIRVGSRLIVLAAAELIDRLLPLVDERASLGERIVHLGHDRIERLARLRIRGLHLIDRVLGLLRRRGQRGLRNLRFSEQRLGLVQHVLPDARRRLLGLVLHLGSLRHRGLDVGLRRIGLARDLDLCLVRRILDGLL